MELSRTDRTLKLLSVRRNMSTDCKSVSPHGSSARQHAAESIRKKVSPMAEVAKTAGITAWTGAWRLPTDKADHQRAVRAQRRRDRLSIRRREERRDAEQDGPWCA